MHEKSKDRETREDWYRFYLQVHGWQEERGLTLPVVWTKPEAHPYHCTLAQAILLQEREDNENKHLERNKWPPA